MLEMLNDTMKVVGIDWSVLQTFLYQSSFGFWVTLDQVPSTSNLNYPLERK
jgi:hypothetical protein